MITAYPSRGSRQLPATHVLLYPLQWSLPSVAKDPRERPPMRAHAWVPAAAYEREGPVPYDGRQVGVPST